MAVPSDPHFPGPLALGRGVVVAPGATAPDGFPTDAARVVIDDDVVAHPSPAVARLHLAWIRREPIIIELVADNAALRQPETSTVHPWLLPHGFTFERERLHFLMWANTYDARSGEAIWWHGELARRRGGAPSEVADVRIDGVDAWADGGPRGPLRSDGDGVATASDSEVETGAPVHHQIDGIGLVHRESIQAGQPRLLGDPAIADPGIEALAPDQQAAVRHETGSARIIAPAGSGKTRVLTARMRHLQHDLGFERSLVTAVAYNTRAAAEMRHRLGQTGSRTIRTFHSLGKWICDLDERREVIDERQQRSILDRLVRTARIPNTDPFQAYLEALALVRLGLVDPVRAGLELELDDFDQTFHEYRSELARRHLIDFDEMVFRAIEVLLTRPDIREQVSRQTTHLLVDEFQDLTPAFHLLMRLVAAPAMQVFGVGDDDQVIYGYAGADPDYLIDFAADFPGAGDHPLTVNYRCPPQVVARVATLLGHNQRRVDKVITSGPIPAPPATAAIVSTPARTPAGAATDHGGASPDIAAAPETDHDGADVEIHAVEAGAMAARTVAIAKDRLDGDTGPTDIAVLARVNASLLPVQVSMALAGIPHTKVLDPSVLQRTGIRTALAYLRLGLDPERMTRADIMETLNRPSRKVKSAVSDHLRGRRFSMTQLAAISDVLSKTHAERWDAYLDDIMALSNAITDQATTAACLHLIRARIGLGVAMATLDSARSRPEGSSHGDDLDALTQLAQLQEQPVMFEEWLRGALALPGDDDGITLSTVHRVKGMEWDHVVVYAASAGLMPHRLAEGPADIEEERRVFHVAVTRCRQSVAIVGDRDAMSPFVDDLRTPAPTTSNGQDAAIAPLETRIVDGEVRATIGVTVTAPGGVAVTVHGMAGVGAQRRVVLDVDGARAHLPLGAPVWVDGQRATLAAPRNTRADRSPGVDDDPNLAGMSRLEAHRQRRQDRLAGTDPEIVLSDEGHIRFEALRQWRTDQARAQGMPPYIIFNDKALTAIADAAPTSPDELARCHGVGPTKLDRYGDEILEVIDGL